MSSTNHKKDIFEAAEQNDEEEVKYFVEEKGVPVTSLNDIDQTIAHIAAKNGNLKILKYALEKDNSILNAKDFYCNTVLFLAIEHGHLQMVKYVVEKQNADIFHHLKCCFSNTATHRAAEFGRLNILKYLIENRKADANVTNILKQSPVFLAAKNKQSSTFKYLVEKLNVDLFLSDYRKCNLLYALVNADDLSTIKYLLDERKEKFDINWKDMDEITLVHRAVILNRVDIVKYLAGEKRAAVTIPDKWGKTPLHSAARWNREEICKCLVENGARTDVEDDKGLLPYQEPSDQSLIEYLKSGSQNRTRRSVDRFRIAINEIEIDDLKQKEPKENIQSLPIFLPVRSSERSVRLPLYSIKPSSSFIFPSIVDVVLSNFGFFLMLSPYFKSRHKLSTHQNVISSPQRILERKVDPVAIDAVHSVPFIIE